MVFAQQEFLSVLMFLRHQSTDLDGQAKRFRASIWMSLKAHQYLTQVTMPPAAFICVFECPWQSCRTTHGCQERKGEHQTSYGQSGIQCNVPQIHFQQWSKSRCFSSYALYSEAQQLVLWAASRHSMPGTIILAAVAFTCTTPAPILLFA